MRVQATRATVPFVKNRQRHGEKVLSGVECDRAFCKNSQKARLKSAFRRRTRPCLLQKIPKGTVEKRIQASRATVPFAKNPQRHGRKVHSGVVHDRAFCKKSSKARSKSAFRRRTRPCLLQKIVKGTVEKHLQPSCATVPFVKKRKKPKWPLRRPSLVEG